jgi:hypothetical protein
MPTDRENDTAMQSNLSAVIGSAYSVVARPNNALEIAADVAVGGSLVPNNGEWGEAARCGRMTLQVEQT